MFKLLSEVLPLIIFFFCFKIGGIFAATAAAIVTGVIQIGLSWWLGKKIEKIQLVTLFLLLAFGGATLLLHNEELIKWKTTAVCWLLAIFLINNALFSKEPFLKKIIGSKMLLPLKKWKMLSWTWGGYFAVAGGANLAVAYLCTTNTWVNFKIFGIGGMTALFALIQLLLLSKHLQVPSTEA